MRNLGELVICWCVLLVSCLSSAQELLVNPGFETGVAGWKGEGFTLQTDTLNVREGSASALATGRTQDWQGPSQDVTLTPGGRYEFNGYIKLVDEFLGKGPQPVYVRITSSFSNGTKQVLDVATRERVDFADVWVRLGGDFLYPNEHYTSAILSVEGPDADVSFNLDETSLVELPEYTSWEDDANQLIEAHRKSNIKFTFNIPASYAAKDVVVHIDHKRHLFGFGSFVRGDLIVEPDYKEYQNIAYHLFNWATISDYKWSSDKGTQGSPDFSVAVAATDELVKNGLKVRGHSLFSAVPGNQPDWVSALTGQNLKNAVDERIKYITGLTKGKVSHWDVNNELLHGHFYEDQTGDPKYTQHIFKAVHTADPGAALFLNDYEVLAGGARNLEYVDQINAFKDANVGIKGVGIQSHLEAFVEPDITLLKARLDRLAEPGVPIWITELSVGAQDDHDKADWYENVLRLFFSHQSVDGVLLWGFWDHDIDPLRALVHGFTYTLDEAGKRYQRLVKQDWSTHVTRSLNAGSSFTVRGFQGDYDVVIYYKGKPIQQLNFTLEKADKTITVDVVSPPNEIQLPPIVDPFSPVDIEFATSSLNLQTLGHVTSTSQSQQLSCVTRWSAESEIGDEKTASISCNSGEVLTGCSSYHKGNDWRRDGEQVTFTNGKAVCTAFNGYYSTAGVQANARCCSLRNFQCRYRTAGPSGTGEQDEVIVPCAGAEYPVGCGTWTFEEESGGTIFTSTFCVGQNSDPRVGVYAFAACCQNPALHCVTMYSEYSGQDVGDKGSISCPKGYGFVMTGCNVHAPNSRAAGAYIEEIDGEDTCVAVNGFQRYGVENGVQATANCCRTVV